MQVIFNSGIRLTIVARNYDKHFGSIYSWQITSHFCVDDVVNQDWPMETNSSSDDDTFTSNMSDPRLNLSELDVHYPVVLKTLIAIQKKGIGSQTWGTLEKIENDSLELTWTIFRHYNLILRLPQSNSIISPVIWFKLKTSKNSL